MQNFKLKAYLGLRFSENLSNSEWENTYKEIEGLSKYYKLFFFDKVIVDKIKFTFAKSKRAITKVKDEFEWLTTDKILIIEFNADFDTFKSNLLDIHFFVEKRIRDLIMAISIAKKGGVDIGDGAVVFINDKRSSRRFTSYIHSIGHSVEKAKKIKWPKLKMIDLKKTINWLHKFEKFTDGLSNDKISRAINAYSYLFKDRGAEDNASELFWTLVGIEALYAEGNTNIVNQVNLKSQLFLGQRKEFKKSFNEMYNYRSRFIHGELDFSTKFILLDNTEEIYKHWTDLDENKNLAVAVLVATFQKLIVSDRTILNFEYKLKNNKKVSSA